MDPTPGCRDKCASSADMLTCMGDCMKKTMATIAPKAVAPKLLGVDLKDKKKIIIGSVATIAAIGVVIFLMKKYHKK